MCQCGMVSERYRRGSLDDEGNSIGVIYDINSLSSYLKNVENVLKEFCEVLSNSSNPLFTICNNYWEYLKDNSMEEHDFTANPIYSWEKYCEDNSISYVHPLQIP